MWASLLQCCRFCMSTLNWFIDFVTRHRVRHSDSMYSSAAKTFMDFHIHALLAHRAGGMEGISSLAGIISEIAISLLCIYHGKFDPYSFYVIRRAFSDDFWSLNGGRRSEMLAFMWIKCNNKKYQEIATRSFFYEDDYKTESGRKDWLPRDLNMCRDTAGWWLLWRSITL